MSDLTQVLGIVLKVDGTLELANGMKLSAGSVSDFGKQLDKLNDSAGNVVPNANSAGQAMGRLVQPAGAAGRATTELGKGATAGATGLTGMNRAVDDTLPKLPRLVEGVNQAAVANQRLAFTARQHAEAMRLLPAQIADVVTSFASGMPVWLIAIQQGGQIKDSFGGIGPAFRAVLSTLTPFNVGIGLATVTVGALTAAVWQGSNQHAAFGRTMVLTGNAAGLMAGQIDSMAASVARSIDGTTAASRETLASLTATGRFTVSNLTQVASAVQLVARYSGESNDKVMRHFAGMADGVADWAAKANRSYNFINVETFRYIQALEQQGRTQEAMRVTAEALTTHLGGSLVTNLGYVERAWDGVKQMASGAWSAMLNVGKPETLDDRLAQVRQDIDEARRRIAGMSPTWDGAALTGARRRLSGLEQRERDLEFEERDARVRAARRAGQAADNQRAIEASRTADTLLAGARSRREQMDAELAAARKAFTDAKRSGDELAKVEAAIREKYAEKPVAPPRTGTPDRTYERMLAQIRERITLADAEIAKGEQLSQSEQQRLRTLQEIDEALAAKRVGPRQAETLRAQAEEEATRRGQVEAMRAFDAEVEANARERNRRQAEADRERTRERAEALREEERMQRQYLQTRQQIDQQLEQMEINSIADPQQRARRQVQADEAAWRERIGLHAQGTQQRQDLEDRFASWMVARQALLTEELKPEWRRMLDGWADTTRLQRDAYDSAMTGILRSGEEAWIELARTGKLNARSMVDGVLVELARLEYRQRIAGPLANMLSSFLSSILPGAGGASAGFTANYSLSSNPNNGAGLRPPGRAAGGPVDRGRLYEVNERRPELLEEGGRTFLMMGSRSGRVIPSEPLRSAPGAAGAAPVVHVAVYNQGQPVQATSQASQRSDGALQIDVLLDAVDEGMAERISTGRGSTVAAIGGRFGLRTALN